MIQKSSELYSDIRDVTDPNEELIYTKSETNYDEVGTFVIDFVQHAMV